MAQIGPDYIRPREDAMLVDMLRGFGAKVSTIEAPFTPERGATIRGRMTMTAITRMA